MAFNYVSTTNSSSGFSWMPNRSTMAGHSSGTIHKLDIDCSSVH